MAMGKNNTKETKKLKGGRPNKNNLGRHRRSTNIFPIVLCFTIIIGVLIGTKSYGYTYKLIASKSLTAEDTEGESTGEKQFSANNIVEQAQNNLVGSDIDGVIKDIDYTEGKMTFYNLKSNETMILTATEDTQYPFPNTINDYKIGDVVTFVFNKDKNVTDIKACSSAWSYSDVGLVVNTDSKLVKFGDASTQYKDKSFKYTEGITTVRYKDEYTTLDQINKLDYVTVRGYDNGTVNKAYSITIEKSHGLLTISNGDAIQDGVVKLNGNEISLSNARNMNLTEGVYTIDVTGSNCDPYTTEVMVSPDEAANVDLSVIQIKTGLLNITTNVSDCTIVIDGVTRQNGEPILLNYGRYSVKVTKPDYQDFNGTVTIDEEENSLSVTLKEKEKSGTIKVTTSPGSAKVYVDGTFVGQSPQNKNVPLGSHTVKVEMDGYIPETKTVNITADGETQQCDITLTPRVTHGSTVESDVTGAE
jgi:hypothetical protein